MISVSLIATARSSSVVRFRKDAQLSQVEHELLSLYDVDLLCEELDGADGSCAASWNDDRLAWRSGTW